MSESDEWAACKRQIDWGFFLLWLTLGPQWRGSGFITVKKKTNGDGHEHIGNKHR